MIKLKKLLIWKKYGVKGCKGELNCFLSTSGIEQKMYYTQAHVLTYLDFPPMYFKLVSILLTPHVCPILLFFFLTISEIKQGACCTLAHILPYRTFSHMYFNKANKHTVFPPAFWKSIKKYAKGEGVLSTFFVRHIII